MTHMDIDALLIPAPDEAKDYHAPSTHYCKTKKEFDEAVGKDFIKQANDNTKNGELFYVGLSHGQSPSGPYEYILENYHTLKHPENIRYTFVNSKLKRQRSLVDVTDAIAFLKILLNTNRVDKDQIFGRSLDRENMETYANRLNKKLNTVLKESGKEGLDYIFLATDPKGKVAGISRNSEAFDSEEIGVIVQLQKEKELTLTPTFIKKSKRIAFLATKADKRRPLAWLFYRWGKSNESPSFLRYMDDVENRMTVFVDDRALTWPRVQVIRETDYGKSKINIDLARTYNPKTKIKRPVVLMVHGFLGLNSFDGMLAAIPSRKYIAAAMHYGSIPNDLPPIEYSEFVMRNIDAVIQYFGDLGHPVYLMDHSMGNIYSLLMDKHWDELKGVNTYLRGRISANPFFGKEAKHALLGFMDNVILKAKLKVTERPLVAGFRKVIPLESRVGVRNLGIRLNKWMISSDTRVRNSIWKAVKDRVLYIMTSLDSLPHLNRIPVEKALNRLPVKVFAIQVYSALESSKYFDRKDNLENMSMHIPILVLKSDKDVIAKFVPDIYMNDSNIEIVDITNYGEQSLFREHLYHMVNPQTTTKIIDQFIQKTETALAEKKTKTRRPSKSREMAEA